MRPSKITLIVIGLTVTVLFGICFLGLVRKGPQDERREKAFQEIIGLPRSKLLLMVTDRQTYKAGEPIMFWVENRTGKALWFPDQSLGVRAFQYDKKTTQWIEVPLLEWGNPTSTPVLPGSDQSFVTETRTESITGEIRLVIIGTTRPNGEGERYLASRDVEIRDRD